MALVVKDRVQETTTTTGTGTYTLAGAVTGYQSFSVIGNGNTTYYAVTNGTDWEVGLGTYTAAGTTLSRNSILESSNSGSAVNWSAGTKQIFVTYPAEKSVLDGEFFNGTVGATTPSTGAFTTLTASGNVTFDTTTLFVDATNNRVGVGTASPSSTLDVNGDITVSGTGRKIQGDWANATLSNRPIFSASTTNSAIGVPFAPTGTATQTDILAFAGSDVLNAPYVAISAFGSGSVCRLIAGKTGTASHYPLAFLTNGSERVRIDTSGNVGVGTSSPGNLFQVSGDTARNTVQAATNTGAVRLEAQVYDYWTGSTFVGTSITQSGAGVAGTTCGVSNASLGSLLFQNTPAGLIYTNGAAPIIFGTTSLERARIDSSGNVGIGATPSATLDVNGPVKTRGQFAANQTSSGGMDFRSDIHAVRFLAWGSVGNNGTFEWLAGSGGASAASRMFIDGSGNVAIGGSSAGHKVDVSGAMRSYGAAAGFILGNRTTATQADRYTLYVTSDTLRFYDNTATTDRVTIDASGNFGIGRTPSYMLDVNSTARFNSTVGVGNAAPAGSGAGITFPATQSASSDANTLDDYEEGSWTPADASGAGLTFTSVTARYTKIGNVVTVFAKLTYPSTVSGVQAKISGLPFATANGGLILFANPGTNTAGAGQGWIDAAGTTMTLVTQANGAKANSQLSTLALYFSGTYLT
jgi:hypothetical protein